MKNDLVNIEQRRRVFVGNNDNDDDDGDNSKDDDNDNDDDDDDGDNNNDNDNDNAWFFQFLAEEVYQMTAKAKLWNRSF